MWRRHKPRRRRRETVTRPLIALSSRKWSWLASQCYSSTQAAYEAHSHKDPLELGEAAHRQGLRSARGQFCPLEILASYSDFRASRAGRARDCERALVKNTSLERGQRAEENAETFTSLRHRVRALCVCEVADKSVSARHARTYVQRARAWIDAGTGPTYTCPLCSCTFITQALSRTCFAPGPSRPRSAWRRFRWPRQRTGRLNGRS